MQRNTILAVLAVILLAFYAGPALLLLLLVILLVYFIMKRNERNGQPSVIYANMEEVEAKYGKPDDVVVLDALRANDLAALILFYTAQDVMIVTGEELKISDMTSVTTKNMATPYTIDEYTVIISTKNPQRPTIYLRVGYDYGLAMEITTQINQQIDAAVRSFTHTCSR